MRFPAFRVLLALVLCSVVASCSGTGTVTAPDSAQTVTMQKNDHAFAQITSCSWMHSVHSPTWSPDGSTIAYSANYDNLYSWQLYTIRIGETDPVRITNLGMFSAFAADWSPDGTQLAFYQASYSVAQLAICDLATGQSHVVPTGMSSRAEDPSWTTDGRIVFCKYTRGYGGWYSAIDIIDPANGSMSQLIGFPAYDPDVNAEGDIAYVSGSRILLLRHGSTIPVVLTDGGIEREPAWSPDGKRIAYAAHADYDRAQIWVMKSDGTQKRLLTDDEFWNVEPAWSPDGKRIAFVSDRSGRTEIWTVKS